MRGGNGTVFASTYLCPRTSHVEAAMPRAVISVANWGGDATVLRRAARWYGGQCAVVVEWGAGAEWGSRLLQAMSVCPGSVTVCVSLGRVDSTSLHCGLCEKRKWPFVCSVRLLAIA